MPSVSLSVDWGWIQNHPLERLADLSFLPKDAVKASSPGTLAEISQAPKETNLVNQSQYIDQPPCEISLSCKQSQLLLASTPNKVTIFGDFNQASWPSHKVSLMLQTKLCLESRHLPE